MPIGGVFGKISFRRLARHFALQPKEEDFLPSGNVQDKFPYRVDTRKGCCCGFFSTYVGHDFCQ